MMKNRYGSVYFASPEVVDQTHNADFLVWNIGAIVFLLLTGRQIYEELGFKKYQSALKANIPDLQTDDFEEVSEELMDLLEKMLVEDQFLRISLNECNHHDVLLKKVYGSDTGYANPDEVKQKLKIYQGEMEMYSNMWGVVYSHLIWEKKWKKRIHKNLERISTNGKISQSQLSEAYKMFTIEPLLLDFHSQELIQELSSEKTEYSINEVIQGMKNIDVKFFYKKIKDSFRYFSDDGKTITQTDLLRVLKRAHLHKESILLDQIKKNLDENGNINYEGVVAINEYLRTK